MAEDLKRISFITSDLKRLDNISADVIALFHFSERRPLRGITSLVDWRLHGHLSKLIIDGFLTGSTEETLLMPTGGRLNQRYLLVFGIGPRVEFGKRACTTVVERMFRVVEGVSQGNIVLSLPGRVEDALEAPEAMEWLLSCYEDVPQAPDLYIIEPTEIQKAIVPIAERWRLRQLVP